MIKFMVNKRFLVVLKKLEFKHGPLAKLKYQVKDTKITVKKR